MIQVQISPGELVDKLSILDIKLREIKSEEKSYNIEKEYNLLYDKYTELSQQIPKQNRDSFYKLYHQLLAINYKIWQIEDDIRDCERRRCFDNEFIELARGVYINNDQRYQIKREINEICESDLIEEKSYQEYK